MSTTAIVVVVLIAITAAIVVSRKKKSRKPDAAQPPVTPPMQPTPVRPQPVPPPATPPSVTPANQPVFLDRNRKSPGDPGYDPRATRPDPEFSPIEPQGTFWGEGPFDPSARYIDLLGRFHNP